MKKSSLNKILMAMGDYYNRKINPALVNMYYEFLKNYTDEAVIAAFKAHVAISPYFPKINDILALIEGTAETKAQRAFAELSKAIQKCGAYASIKFLDPVLNKTILDFNGWVEICRIPSHEWSYFQHRFIRQYMHNLMTKQIYSGHHPGLIESQNKKFPEHIPQPVLWGESRQKEKTVHAITKS